MDDDNHTITHSIISLFQRTDAEPTKLEAARAIASLCRFLHSTPVLPAWDPASEAYEAAKNAISALPSPPVSEDEPRGGPEEGSRRRERFYNEHNVEIPLAYLITQQKWPILRSEAWFVFALMGRSVDGAGVILRILQDQSALDRLSETVIGRSAGEMAETRLIENGDTYTDPTQQLELEPQRVDPTQQANMKRVDRENALVMCTELLKASAPEAISSRRDILQALVQEGTELVAAEKRPILR